MDPVIRNAAETDLPRLLELEANGFSSDRLSRRSFRHWIRASHGILLVVEAQGRVAGYGLAMLHKGTRLARLYSLAVDPTEQGKGLGRLLILGLEEEAAARGRLYMRLEVAAGNRAAIHLYESMEYRKFGIYPDYYEDHNDALRMQKRIKQPSVAQLSVKPTPWYRQSTPFTCGPAALMMAMASLDKHLALSQDLEFDLWREATTIFMTSGHGGCHPIGLALSAHDRGYKAKVILNRKGPLFIDGVRSQYKKEVVALVDQQFRRRARDAGISIAYSDSPLSGIEHALMAGDAVIVLVSTYQTTGNKAPHWVTATTIDDQCLYVNDPDPSDDQSAFDCQHIPIALEDFARMSVYGNSRLRTAVIIGPRRGQDMHAGV
jgi:ribosomal protein S18 acetylase RimI-like enzyme